MGRGSGTVLVIGGVPRKMAAVALAAAPFAGCAGAVERTAHVTRAPLPPVTIRLPVTTSVDLTAANRLPVILRTPHARRVRVAALTRSASGATVTLGARTIAVAANRPVSVSLALTRAARSSLAACPGVSIVVTVTGARLGPPRTVGRTVSVAPPACGRFFGRTTVWNSPLAPDARLDPESAAVTQDLIDKVDAGTRNGLPATIATTAYAPPVYTVPASQPRVRVTLQPGHDTALAAVFASVPLPPKATPAPGSDHELVVWQPATDTLWEFWRLRRANGGWQATWGGRLDHVSTGPGHFAEPHSSWGTTASSLPLVGGMVTPHEFATGEIDHALALSVPRTRESAFSRPAQRTDGVSQCPHAVPEGARFRLDPTLDVASLGLPPPVAAIARAAQRYGIFVRDQSDSVTFYAQSSVSLPTDPYPALFGGRPAYDLLAQFPWAHLQLVQMQLVPTGRGSPLQPLLEHCS